MSSRKVRGKVFIGMPVYNAARFINKSLDSLLSQTYRDIEILISDNASTDETQAICEEYVRKDSRVRYNRNSENLGADRNFEYVFAQSDGEFFMWASDDDIWMEDFIEKGVKSLQENPVAIASISPIGLILKNGSLKSTDAAVHEIQEDSVFSRILKVTKKDYGELIFSLYRRKALKGIHFPTWWWPNQKTARGTISPPLYFLLSRGTFVLSTNKPIFFRRSFTVDSRVYDMPLSDLGKIPEAFAYILRIFNMFILNIKFFYLGSKNVSLTVLISPLAFYGFLIDLSYPITERLFRHSRNLISKLSKK